MASPDNPHTADQTVLLKLEGVSKAYRQRKVLDAVSFRLGPGERIALMGPSGSGKSTLLNCISGLDSPDTGSVFFDGQNLAALSNEKKTLVRRSGIGSIFQFFHLMPTLTALENVALSLQLNGHSQDTQTRRAMEMLVEVGVDHRAKAFPRELSGGEMQRVAIARALVLNPKLLLADEPTGNLDAENGRRILDLMETLSHQHRAALILVTHQPETTRICHRTLHLRDGRILQDTAEPGFTN